MKETFSITNRQITDLVKGIAREVAHEVTGKLLNERPATLLSVHDVAKGYNFAPNTVRRWINNRRIRYIKIDGKVMIAQGDLNDFFNSNKIEPVDHAL